MVEVLPMRWMMVKMMIMMQAEGALYLHIRVWSGDDLTRLATQCALGITTASVDGTNFA